MSKPPYSHHRNYCWGGTPSQQSCRNPLFWKISHLGRHRCTGLVRSKTRIAHKRRAKEHVRKARLSWAPHHRAPVSATYGYRCNCVFPSSTRHDLRNARAADAYACEKSYHGGQEWTRYFYLKTLLAQWRRYPGKTFLAQRGAIREIITGFGDIHIYWRTITNSVDRCRTALPPEELMWSWRIYPTISSVMKITNSLIDVKPLCSHQRNYCWCRTPTQQSCLISFCLIISKIREMFKILKICHKNRAPKSYL